MNRKTNITTYTAFVLALAAMALSVGLFQAGQDSSLYLDRPAISRTTGQVAP